MGGGHRIESVEQLEALYGVPSEGSLAKEVDHVHPHYRALIEASPFVLVATSGPKGLDVTPRGDVAPVVTVEDPSTLLLPDRRGNNRLDSLRNLLHDPRVALLFLIPGVGETLRVRGRARISVDPGLLERFAVKGRPPATVLVIAVESVFFQCAKSVVRAGLWDLDRHVARASLPSTGTILADLSRGRLGGADYDQALEERTRATLY
jgi:uncharacterized protein